MSKNVFEQGFCIGKGDNQKSLTLVSGKFVDFIQTFGPMVSFSYNLVLLFLICYKIFKLLFFFGKIVTSLANN